MPKLPRVFKSLLVRTAKLKEMLKSSVRCGLRIGLNHGVAHLLITMNKNIVTQPEGLERPGNNRQ